MNKLSLLTYKVSMLMICMALPAAALWKEDPNDSYSQAIEKLDANRVASLLKSGKQLTVFGVNSYVKECYASDRRMYHAQLDSAEYDDDSSLVVANVDLRQLDTIGEHLKELYLKKGGKKPAGVDDAVWKEFKERAWPLKCLDWTADDFDVHARNAEQLEGESVTDHPCVVFIDEIDLCALGEERRKAQLLRDILYQKVFGELAEDHADKCDESDSWVTGGSAAQAEHEERNKRLDEMSRKTNAFIKELAAAKNKK